MVTNAYNFGSDTAEGISNTLSKAYYYLDTGELFASISAGSGSLTDLYYQSQISVITVTTSLNSGTLSVKAASTPNATPWQTPYSNGEVEITIASGDYSLELYQNGTFYDQASCTINGGQTLTLPMSMGTTSITLLAADSSNPLSSNDFFEVNYTLYGQEREAFAQTGSLYLNTDLGSSVIISGISNDSSTAEEWVLNGFNDPANVTAGSTTTYYYYDLLSQQVAYWGPNNSSIINPYITYTTAPLFLWGPSSSPDPATCSELMPYLFQQTIWALRGTIASANSTIPGTQQDQWATLTSAWTITQTNKINDDVFYYHQYQFTTSYATPDGSIPSTVPMLSGTQFGSLFELALTTTEQSVWLDQNTAWSIDNLITAPSGVE